MVTAASSDDVFYGFPDECKKFEQRHPLWQEIMHNLENALNIAFKRIQITKGPEDRFVYLFGRLCVEDFMEILLICCHGYGTAASKLVRSMYEHAVTLHYLHEHPKEATTFMNYHLVQQERLLNRLIETFGSDILPADQIAETKRKAAEVKEDFMVPVCDHPGSKKRLRHTWNKLDFAAMAKKAGSLGTLIVPGYYLPLRHAHATFGGLSELIEIVDDRMGIDPDSQPELADRSLMTAHNCMLAVLEVQKDYFKLEELNEPLQLCLKDWVRVWSPESSLLKNTDI